MMTTGIALTYVIECFGVELLPAADLLREMLFSKHKAYLASDAIARMGRPGLEFYDDLLSGLRSDDGNHYCAKALGVLLRDAPERIPEILELACAPSAIACGMVSAVCQRARGASLHSMARQRQRSVLSMSTRWAAVPASTMHGCK